MWENFVASTLNRFRLSKLFGLDQTLFPLMLEMINKISMKT